MELIDAAEKSIEIVNPYLNPPPAIEAAFARALLQRGVKITIIARINLRGDLGGQFLTELNELFVEKYADRMVMYEYLEPDVVLHSKFFMIDEKALGDLIDEFQSPLVHSRQRERDELSRSRTIPALQTGVRKVSCGFAASDIRCRHPAALPVAARFFAGSGSALGHQRFAAHFQMQF